uniref:Uncharacterized protein n=1 Tax=Lepeophtheirus salmonis TaxID=72036 RepID=A0A0K2U2H1_LEPSM
MSAGGRDVAPLPHI